MPLTPRDREKMSRGAPAEAWSSVTVDGTHVERRWLTILQYDTEAGVRHRFGLLDDGSWSARYADGERVSRPGNLVPFLPLLARSWPLVALQVVSAVRDLNMPDKLAWTFPLDELVVLGLGSSDHWRAKAEAWISSGYPMTDEMAALVPRHPRSRARHRERMVSIFDANHTPLRAELESAEGSFLIKLRVELKWDKAAFNRLVHEMHKYVRERDHEAPIPRWIAHGFWFLDWWVKLWSSHEVFPRIHGDSYYEAAYERLHLLASWLFNGSPMTQGGEEQYAPL